MSEDNITKNSIGDTLRKARSEKGFSLEQISEETKISLKSLRAIEADDYVSLPAPAFSKGFYRLYADALGLDGVKTQQKYEDTLQKTNGLHPSSQRTSPQEVGNLAERPPIPIMTIISFALMLSLVVFATLAWYFSWNPAEYLSKQLRSVEIESMTNEKTNDESIETAKEENNKETTSASSSGESDKLITKNESLPLSASFLEPPAETIQ